MAYVFFSIILEYIRKSHINAIANSDSFSEDESFIQNKKGLKLPKNKKSRRLIIYVIIILFLHILESCIEIYDPINSMIYGIHHQLEFCVRDYIIYLTREMFDIVTGMAFLYLVYTLCMKRLKN